MSLWLPRTSPTVLARSYSRSHPILRSHLISNLTLRACATSQSRSALLPSRRLQSSKVGAHDSASLPTDPSASSDPKPGPPIPKDGAPQGPLATRVWKKVKHEAAHYWHGMKLLVSEVRISARLQWKILHGESLTRRERRQVCRGFLYKLSNKLLTFITRISVETHHAGHTETCTVCCLRDCAVHGTLASGSAGSLSQHAAIDI